MQIGMIGLGRMGASMVRGSGGGLYQTVSDCINMRIFTQPRNQLGFPLGHPEANALMMSMYFIS